MKTKTTTSKAGTILGTVGLVGGALYAFNKGEKIGKVAIWAGILGVGGLLIGNAITKFYE